MQTGFVENIERQFLAGKHGERGTARIGTKFGGFFDGEIGILADHRHDHADHDLQPSDFPGFVLALLKILLPTPNENTLPGSDSITVLQRGSDPSVWNATNVSVGKGPEGGDISPDGREYWAANSGDGTISIVDAATKKVVQTVDIHTKRSNRLKFTLDGKLVLVSDLAGNELIVLDASWRKEIKRLNLGRQPEGVLISPDGAHAYIAVAGEKNVAILDLKTLEVSARIPTGAGPDGMAWAVRR